jgi:hypothetical protein
LLFDYLNSPAGREDPARATKLRRMTESWDVGIKLGIDGFFSSRFARTEVGTTGRLRERYDAQRQYETGKSEAAKNSDLDAQAHLTGLDSLLSKQDSMIGAIVVVGLAVWLMTLAYDTQPSYRMFPAGLAVMVYIGGAAFAAYVYWLQ